MKIDKKLFKILDKKTHKKFKDFAKYFVNDSKPFINKISRDYEKSEKFPIHVLKQIKMIPKSKYDSGICVLRGGLPYSILFEAYGWKIHYVICGRRSEKITPGIWGKRFSKSVDETLNKIKEKKVLLIENNSYNGATTRRVSLELKKAFKIKKPDLFLDYFVDWIKYPHMKKFPKESFLKYNKKLQNNFGKIYEASSCKVSEKERNKLIEEFLEKLK